MNEYNKQAEEFLKKTDSSLKIEFKENGVYPNFSDEEKRDIYNITLTKGEREYKFTFGNSIARSGLFKTNERKEKDRIKPTAYDILAGMTTQDPDDFDWFCSMYGYDNDSRKAEKIYEAVKKEFDNLKMLYSDSELELLSQIQ